MAAYDQQFIRQMEEELEVDLLGVAPIDDSSPKELKDCADALMPTATSAVVLGKEICLSNLSTNRPNLQYLHESLLKKLISAPRIALKLREYK